MRGSQSFEGYIRELVAQRGYGYERTYAGITDVDTADRIRKQFRTAGQGAGLAVKSFYEPCGNDRCPAGPECRWHVRYAAYQKVDAWRYKRELASRNLAGYKDAVR